MNKYDNLFLPTDDLTAAKRFYGEVLGLKLKFDFSEKGMVAFHVGEEEPAIILKDIHKHKEAVPTIWFEVDNVAVHYAQLKEAGVSFLSEPFEIGTGNAVEFEDQFGNRLGITDYRK